MDALNMDVLQILEANNETIIQTELLKDILQSEGQHERPCPYFEGQLVLVTFQPI